MTISINKTGDAKTVTTSTRCIYIPRIAVYSRYHMTLEISTTTVKLCNARNITRENCVCSINKVVFSFLNLNRGYEKLGFLKSKR